MSAGRVVYATFATTRPSGGVVVQSRHVALLRAAGRDAFLWLPAGSVPGWFDPSVPVLTGATLDVGPDDLLVLPEVPVVPGNDPAPGARKVIFNQNHFYTFAAGDSGPYPGWEPAPDVWTVSRESRAVLAAVHPALTVSLVPAPVDTALFVPVPTARPGVAWISRKRPHETAIVRRLLQQDVRLADVDLLEIVDSPRTEVARILGAATVFVSFGHSEGFGLPTAEALAAGCLVTGYDGGGGVELFDAPGAWRVPEQRPLLLVERVVDLVQRSAGLTGLAAANRSWVLERYGPDVTAAALITALGTAFARPGAAARATHPAAALDRVPADFTRSG